MNSGGTDYSGGMLQRYIKLRAVLQKLKQEQPDIDNYADEMRAVLHKRNVELPLNSDSEIRELLVSLYIEARLERIYMLPDASITNEG